MANGQVGTVVRETVCTARNLGGAVVSVGDGAIGVVETVTVQGFKMLHGALNIVRRNVACRR